MRHRPDLREPFAAAVVAVALVALPFAAGAERSESVTEWASHEAVPLVTVDPNPAPDDFIALRPSIGDARIVGLGESVHGASEILTLKHRTLRFLVERMGFRSVAWEEDWTTGLEIDRYIRTGRGNVDALVREMSPQWQSHEVADVLRWLRQYNVRHVDDVRFFGVEYYFTRRAAYDAVEDYVAQAAPDRLAELRRHLRVIRPFTADEFAYVDWYWSRPDKRPYIRHAHAVLDLLRDLRPGRSERAHQVALHHARQIVSFYEHYDLSMAASNVYREQHAARNLRWWQRFSDHDVAYWAASPHSANAPDLQIVQPEGQDMRFASAGSYLRRWYGDEYLSIGFTFDHGTVSLGSGATADLPPPRPAWFEQPLGDVRLAQFALDLRGRAPRPVRQWLHHPIETRGLADSGPGGYMTGGSLAQWFDLIVHRQTVSPSSPP